MNPVLMSTEHPKSNKVSRSPRFKSKFRMTNKKAGTVEHESDDDLCYRKCELLPRNDHEVNFKKEVIKTFQYFLDNMPKMKRTKAEQEVKQTLKNNIYNTV